MWSYIKLSGRYWRVLELFDQTSLSHHTLNHPVMKKSSPESSALLRSDGSLSLAFSFFGKTQRSSNTDEEDRDKSLGSFLS